MVVLIILGITFVLIVAHSFDSASYQEKWRNGIPFENTKKRKK